VPAFTRDINTGGAFLTERTNTLIVSDIAGNLDVADELVRNLDTQTPQVQIEARIVEARVNFARELGIQWGGNFLASSANGNPTGLTFPSSIGIGGGAQDQTTNANGILNGQAANPNFVVNLPANVGSNSGGALGLTLGSIGGNFNVNLRLSALENTGNIRILSAPKVTTLDNVESSIEQGIAVPVTVVSARGPHTVYVDAKLSLTVKPHITNDGSIVMNVIVTNNQPDFSRVGTLGSPVILKNQAKTQLVVRDGDTAVIGGIYTRTTSVNYNKIPMLGDIPVLGWLFKSKRTSDDRSELLIFITPKVLTRTPAASR
jgi:type IV pilus assembly protein PilQ